MHRDEVAKLKEGDLVAVNVGPHKGVTFSVVKTEMDSGAYHGWVTVRSLKGHCYLYAGQEIDLPLVPSIAWRDI